MTEAAAQDDRRIVFTILLKVKPDRVEDFLALLTPLLDAMRHEPTFINCVLHKSPDDPAVFMLYETWADLDELKAVQVHRDYRKAFTDALPDLLSEPRQVTFWTSMRGDFAFLQPG